MGAHTIYNQLSNVLEFNEMTMNMKSTKQNCFTDTLWLFRWYGDQPSFSQPDKPPRLCNHLTMNTGFTLLVRVKFRGS